MLRAVPCAVLVGAFLAIAPLRAVAGQRVVIIYENRSGNRAAVDLVSSSLGGTLARKGYEVVDDPEVTDFLDALHVVHVEPLAPALVNRLLLRFHADRVLAVVINFVLEAASRSNGPGSSPAVGLTAKLHAVEGAVLWRNSLGVLSDDVTHGQARDSRAGAIRSVVSTACERLTFTAPKAKPVAEVVSEDSRPNSRAAQRGGPRFPLVNAKESLRAARARPEPTEVSR